MVGIMKNKIVIIVTFLFLISVGNLAFSEGETDEGWLKFLHELAEEEGAEIPQYWLGNEYYYGEEVEKDYTEALKWYRKAAEQGNVDAQFYLGWMYGKGLGVTKDDKEAATWYRKAAEQGNAVAQDNLGLMYYHGEGVTKDDKEAVNWFLKAAEQGLAEAQYNLGLVYANGEGVEKDYNEAIKLYRKAAAQGYARAQYNLGVYYYNVDDYIEAFKWFSIAISGGKMEDLEVPENIDNLLKALTSKMTGSQITEAMRRKTEWVKSHNP